MKTQRPITSEVSEEEHRVLQFRPRTPPPGRPGKLRHPGPQHYAGKNPTTCRAYERVRERPDDFRHRMLANLRPSLLPLR